MQHVNRLAGSIERCLVKRTAIPAQNGQHFEILKKALTFVSTFPFMYRL